MKKIYTTLLLLAVVFFANALTTETILRIDSFSTPYTWQCMNFYIGNNQMLTVALMTSYDYNYNYSSAYYRVSVNDLNGTSIMHSTITLDTPNYQPMLFDAGKTPDGGYYIYGARNTSDSFNSNVQLNLIKLNSNGMLAWNSKVIMNDFAYTWGSPLKVRINSAGDFYLNGNADHSMTVCKIGANGSFKWGKNLSFTTGTNKTPLPDMSLSGDTAIILAGNPTQSNNAYVLLDSTGNVQWANNYSNGNYTTPTVIITNSSGTYTVGSVNSSTSTVSIWTVGSDGELLWRKTYTCFGYTLRMVELADHTMMMAVNGNSIATTLIHIDANGNILDKKTVLGGNNGTLGSLTAEGNDFILTAMLTTPGDSTYAAFVLKASSLSGLCESLNMPVTAATDNTPLSLMGTEANLFIGNLNGSSAPVITASTAITYHATATDYCSYMLPVDALAAATQITVYPIPATDQLNISLPETPTGAQLNIYNTTGALLLTERLLTQHSTLNISNFPGGVYIAEIKTGNTTSVKRWVKM